MPAPGGRAARLLCAWAIVSAGMGLASATERTQRDPELNLERSRRLGPFHVQPYFLVKRAGYDDNILLGSGESGQGSFTATLGPGARAVILLGSRAALLVAEELDYVYVDGHSELNHFNSGSRTKLDIFAGRALLYVDIHHQTARERPSPEVDFRIRNSSFGQTVGARADLSKRLSAGVQTGWQQVEYGTGVEPEELLAAGPDGETLVRSLRDLNRTESFLSTFVSYRALRKTSVGIETEMQRADFDDPASTRDTRGRRVSLVVSMAPTALVGGNVALGRLRLEALERDDPGFDGLVGEAGLTFRISSRGHARTRYNRNAAYSILGENLLYVTSGWRLTYAHHISERWSVELEHGRDELDHPRPFTQSFIGGTESGRRQDDIRINAVSGVWRVKKGTRVGLRLEQWIRTSNFDLADVERRVVSTFMEVNY